MVTPRIHHRGLSVGRAGRFNTTQPDVEAAGREIIPSLLLCKPPSAPHGEGDVAREWKTENKETEGEYQLFCTNK